MLKGQAKTDYQREYMRKKRGSNTMGLTRSNTGLTDKLKAVGLTVKGNEIMSASKGVTLSLIPLYNPAIHKTGDRVLIRPLYGKKLIETIIPEIDAEGQPIPQ